MKTKDIRNVSIIALAAGLVLVPLARYIISRRKSTLREMGNEVVATGKGLFSAYLGKHNPHHRKVQMDGHHLNN